MQTFLETHGAARAVIALSVLASAVLEWTVTARTRQRTTLAPHAGTGKAKDTDRGTKWVVVGALFVAILLGWWAATTVSGAQMPGNGWIYVGAGLVLIWAGAGLRVWAIAVLGRFFRRVVVIQEGHRVVTDGPYQVIRHPAYAGTLLIAAGLGVALGNWLSLAILVVVPMLGHLPRIRVEECELERALADAYRQYKAVTRRLVPGVW